MAVLFLSLVCFVLMLFPFSVGEWLRVHWQWPFFGCLGAVCYLPTRSILEWNDRREETNRQGERFQHLTDDEKKALVRFIGQGETSLQFNTGDPVAIGLHQENVLLYVSSITPNTHWYRLAPQARAYLKKHPDLLGL